MTVLVGDCVERMAELPANSIDAIVTDPPNGTILDPFTGSGTTGAAAALERVTFIGIECDPEYAAAIATARIRWWQDHPDGIELTARLAAEQDRAATLERGQDSLFA